MTSHTGDGATSDTPLDLRKHYPRYYPLFLTALRTGMRVGELVALKPGDFDFAGNFHPGKTWLRSR
ncbi:MAG: hypothetical protein SWE60_14770 [Thermodesulfobacteriota bacterium]|nr:hypothetical protein [Thermodesulfobacteriota bacterium]